MIALILLAAMQHWLIVNDIHLDPFSKAGPTRGYDTTPALWRSAVEEMRRVDSDPTVVVLGGDMLAHDFGALAINARKPDERSALDVDRTIARDLGTAYPHAQFLVAQGNNDDPCGDYRTENSDGAYMNALAKIWQPLVDRNDAAPDFTAQFERGGYYTARLPVRNGRAIVLNSVMWSIIYRGACWSHQRNPGRTQLTWLGRQLSALPSDANAIVVMHIPVGYDPTSTIIAHRFISVPFLAPSNNAALIATLRAHEKVIRAIYAAHTHRYDFRVLGSIPMLIGSSVSAVYNNNPAFFDVTVDGENGAIVDVQPYVYDLFDEAWEREPSFDHMYGIDGFTAPALRAVSERIRQDPRTRDTWEHAYDAWSWAVGDLRRDWLPAACAQTAFDADYAQCAQTTRRTLSLEVLAAAIGAVVIALAFYLVVRWRRSRSAA